MLRGVRKGDKQRIVAPNGASKMLQIACSKMTYHMDLGEWGGYLTASEYVCLMEEGGLTPADPQEQEHVALDIKRGRGRPNWHYFSARGLS